MKKCGKTTQLIANELKRSSKVLVSIFFSDGKLNQYVLEVPKIQKFLIVSAAETTIQNYTLSKKPITK